MNNKHSDAEGSAFWGIPGPSVDLRGRGTGMTQLQEPRETWSSVIKLHVRSLHVFQKTSRPVMMLIIYNRNLPHAETEKQVETQSPALNPGF